MDGKLDNVVEYVEAAAQRTCVVHSDECVLQARIRLACIIAHLGDISRARQILDSSTRSTEASDNRWLTTASTIARSSIMSMTESADTVMALATSGLREAGKIGMRAWTPVAHAVLATLACRKGDLLSAIEYAGQLQDDSIFSRAMRPAGQSAWIVVQITAAEKGMHEAVPLAFELLNSAAMTRELFISQPGSAPWLVRFALSCGERALAEKAVASARELASANPAFPTVEATALHAEGILHEDEHRLRAAIGMHVDKWAQASALEVLGVILHRADPQSDEAHEALVQSRDLFTEIGALHDVFRVNRRIRDIGKRSVSRHLSRPVSGVSSLTETEYAVANVVAQGYTNAQAAALLYLSRHTIAFHLRKIFRKVNVDSRVQLARAWKGIDNASSSAPSTRNEPVRV